jgi:hypothetical protein
MEKDQKLNIGVGTEEGWQKLEAKPVKVISIDIQSHDFNGKPVDQLIVMAKHPDKPEPFQIYNVSYLKGTSIKSVGFTIYYDSTGKLLKGTAPAEILRVFNLPNIASIVGKDFPTMVNQKGYLSIKAY